MKKYTIFCRQSNGQGTMHIDTHEAETADEAAVLGIAQCRADWDWEDPIFDEDVVVVGIATVTDGEIDIVDWNDD